MDPKVPGEQLSAGQADVLRRIFPVVRTFWEESESKSPAGLPGKARRLSFFFFP